MFERFTDRAAGRRPRGTKRGCSITTTSAPEHILLGLIREGRGVPPTARSWDLARRVHRTGRGPIIGQGQQAPSGHIPFTPRARRCSFVAARALQLRPQLHRHRAHPARPGPRGEGVAARVLVKLGADLSRASRSSSCWRLPGRAAPGRQGQQGRHPSVRWSSTVRPETRPRPRRASSTRHRARRRSSGSCRCCPAHQEQPGADRRARRRQDRRRRRAGPGRSSTATCPRRSRTSSSTRSTSGGSPGIALPRRLRGAPEEGPQRDQTRGDIILFIDGCTPSVGAGGRRVRSTPRRSSSRCWPAASCRPSVPPRSTSTASTSRRTRRWSAASSRSRWAPTLPHHRSILKGLRDRCRRTTGSRSPTVRWSPRPTLADRYVNDRFPTAGQGHRPDRRGRRRLRIRRMTAPPDLRGSTSKSPTCGWRRTRRSTQAGLRAAAGLRDEEKKLRASRQAEVERPGRPATWTSWPGGR